MLMRSRYAVMLTSMHSLRQFLLSALSCSRPSMSGDTVTARSKTGMHWCSALRPAAFPMMSGTAYHKPSS